MREELLALYALDAELAHVHRHVSEEMIGHIRYAWWSESIEAIAAGKPAREHPVLQALAPLVETQHVPPATLLSLVEHYRGFYPEMPPDREQLLDALSLSLLTNRAPQSIPAWSKAKMIIDKHQRRYKDGARGWLAFKLLLAGVF